MTDNRTTELREKLDELGIEHFDYDKGGRTQTQWEAPDGKRHFTYETSDSPAKTARLVIAWHPTPDQAIAATLGSGTLTADDVLNAVYKHGARWQAIADELNAALGSEDTSRWAELFGTPERAAQTLAIGDRHADCSECVIRETCYSSDVGCLVEEPDVLLEWLRGDAE